MNTQGLSTKVLGVMGYGVTVVPGWRYEQSAHEKSTERLTRMRACKKNPELKRDLDAMVRRLLKRMPDTFTVKQLGEKNLIDPRIFTLDYLGGMMRYFHPYCDVKIVVERGCRVYKYTKKEKNEIKEG